MNKTISPHPNQRGKLKRTRLAGGPYVDTSTTLKQFDKWKAKGVSQGVIIDRLAALAKRTKYDPTKETK